MLEFIKQYYDGCTLRDGTDFFHFFLDDGKNREIGVYSSQQKGVKTVTDQSSVEVFYDSLVDNYGNRHDIQFTAKITKSKNGLYFYGKIINNSPVRVNEVQYPYIQFDKTFCEKEDEILYCPFGLGYRKKNPRAQVKNAHSEYIYADYKKVIKTYGYPSVLTMPWLGIQSDDKFLHFQREDELGEICAINLACDPRNSEYENDLTVFVSSYPTLVSGEEIELAPVFTAVFDGNWTKGADCYKNWMLQSDWYTPRKPLASIRNMAGFQRIIMKHQYGEIFFKYKDLVHIFEEGKKYGITHILLFGWWKGCFDNGYPKYEPDIEMGGEEELKKAIHEIEKRGGYVYLYSNGKLIDINSDFFKEHGDEACVVDLDGNFSYEKYPFGDDGTLLRNFGYKTFSTACFGSTVWQEKLLETAKIKLAFNPSGIFFDQFGGQWGRMPLCFNATHKHKHRAACDSPYRIEAIKRLHEILPEGKSIGTEYFVDRYAIHFDYIHGCNFGCQMHPDAYPYIMKYIFPDIVITNRWMHDEKPGYKDGLNYSLVFGLAFDVSIYRGRMGGMLSQVRYSEHVKRLIDIKEKYKEYFYSPSFFYEEALDSLPSGVLGACYNKNGSKLYVFMNKTDMDITFKYGDMCVTVSAHDVTCMEG